jgi:arylsulfatase A-like enzyme
MFNPTRLPFWIGIVVAWSSLAASAEAQTKQARRPNILVIVADDMGFADVGYHGCKDIPTPNIDRIAKAGTRFTSGYVSGPYCSPTRAGLLTGKYQTRFGHEFNPGEGKKEVEFGLPVTQVTIANRLKAAGYVTGLIGKWHLGDAAKYQPQMRGFDEFYGFLGGAHPYFPGKGAPIFRGTSVAMERDYLTDAFAREATDFVDKHRQEPFFLYLAFNAVHTPMQATDARLKKFESIADPMRRKYAAMTWAMDEAIGQVLDKLREAGLEDDTLIFFFSDNGGPTMAGTTINGSRNTPLRGSKRTTLEGGIRVPFLISWPGKVPAGKTIDDPVIQLDVLPTALAAAGVAAKAEDSLDGVDLTPYVSGAKTGAPHETLYWRLGQQMAIRQGDWTLVRYDAGADIGKSIGTVVGPRLYNLRDDIGQTKDLSAAQAERAQQMLQTWERWSAAQARPLWGAGNKKTESE